MPRLLFHFSRNTHFPILIPVLKEALKIDEFEIGIYTPADVLSRELSLEADVLSDFDMPPDPRIKLVGSPIDFKPDVTIVTDAVNRLSGNAGMVVNLWNGRLPKGKYFSENGYIKRENLRHLLLVPGQYHYDLLRNTNRVFIPVKVVGYPRLDELFSPIDTSSSFIRENYGIDPEKMIVLYLPTKTVAIYGQATLWSRIHALSGENRCVAVKFPINTLDEFVEHHKKLAGDNRSIQIFKNENINGLIKAADVVVTDDPGIYIEYGLLEKQVILIDNPGRSAYDYYDTSDLEYVWRDAGITTASFNEAIYAVERCIDSPFEFTAARREAIQRYGIPTDGESSRRVVKSIMELISGKSEAHRIVTPGRIALIFRGIHDVVQLERLIYQIYSYSGEQPVFWIVGDSYHTSDLQQLQQTFGDRIETVSISELSAKINSVDFVGLVPDSIRAGERWLFRLINHLRRNSNIDAVVPCAIGGAPVQNPHFLLSDDASLLLKPADLDREMKIKFNAETVKLPEPPRYDTGIMKSRCELPDGLLEWVAGSHVNPFGEAYLAQDVVVELTPPDYLFTREDYISFIKTLARQAGSLATMESPAQRVRRLNAEELVRQSLQNLDSGDIVRASECAKESLNLVLECIKAEMILAEINSLKQPLNDMGRSSSIADKSTDSRRS